MVKSLHIGQRGIGAIGLSLGITFVIGLSFGAIKLSNNVLIRRVSTQLNGMEASYAGEIVAFSTYETHRESPPVDTNAANELSEDFTAKGDSVLDRSGRASIVRTVAVEAGFVSFCSKIVFKGDNKTYERCLAKYPEPVLALTAASASIPAGSSTTLSWTTEHARSCHLENLSGGQCLSDSSRCGDFVGTNQATIPLASTTIFRLYCTGFGGSSSAEVTVNVGATVPQPPPSATLTLSPPSVVVNSATQLSWTSTNAQGCQLTNLTGGACLADASKCDDLSGSNESSIVLTTNTSFRLTCWGPGGLIHVNRTATVFAAPPPAPACEPIPFNNMFGPGYNIAVIQRDCAAGLGLDQLVPDGEDVHFDDASAAEICRCKGYARVVSKSSGQYVSPADNKVAYFQSGAWSIVSAHDPFDFENRRTYIDQISCDTPIVPCP